MASPVLVPARIAALIALGKRDDLDRLAPEDIPGVIQERDELMRVHWRDWDVVTATIPLDDLVALVKALTIVERLFRWAGSSVSSVIWTLRDLAERDQALGQQVAAWVLERTENDYVAKEAQWASLTVEEQLAEQASQRAAAEAQSQREVGQQEQAEARRAARITQEEERQQSKAMDSARREEEIAELRSMPVLNRLSQIAESPYHLHYWPDEFAQASPEELTLLEEGVRSKLAERAAASDRRAWKSLRDACLGDITNK